MFRLFGVHLQAINTRNIKITHLLTPWNKVIIEKLTVPQLVKQFHALYGTRSFTTAINRFHVLTTRLAEPFNINIISTPRPSMWVFL